MDDKLKGSKIPKCLAEINKITWKNWKIRDKLNIPVDAVVFIDGVLTVGHHRLEAAKKLGLSIKVVYLIHKDGELVIDKVVRAT